MSLPVTEHVFTTLDGETLKTLNIKNVVRCHGIPGAAEAIEHLPSFKAREDDIWVNAFPKSGEYVQQHEHNLFDGQNIAKFE